MKSEFNFRLVSSNGAVIDMDERNYWVSKFRIQPPSFSRNLSKVDGRHGKIEMDVTIDTRLIDVEIQIEGYDPVDFDLLRDEIYLLFNPMAEYYIVRDLQPGKRYKVKVAQLSGIDFEDGSLEDGSFTVQFEMLQPFAESIGTSLDLQNRKEWDADLWQWGMGIDYDEEYRYEHTANIFVVKNIGNVVIDPREHELEITLRGTFPSNVTIRNKTTGDEFIYNGTLIATDTLKLTGVRTLKNDVSVLKDTNKKLITLAPGVNEFEVLGGTVSSIAFNFRFLYM